MGVDSYKSPITLFEPSVKKGDLETVRLLMDHGVHVDAPVGGSDGMLSIHVVCSDGHLEIVKFLVDRGAQVSGVNTAHGSSSPLSLTCRFGHFEVVQWLVENGALMKDHSAVGRTPLVEAVLYGDVRIVQCLVAAGAVATSKDDPKESA